MHDRSSYMGLVKPTRKTIDIDLMLLVCVTMLDNLVLFFSVPTSLWFNHSTAFG